MKATSSRWTLPAIMLGFSLAVAVSAAIRFWNAGIVHPKPVSAWPTGGFVSVVGAFMFGGVLGRFRSLGKGVQAGFVTHLGVTCLLLAVTVAWWYETTAVASGGRWPPITTFLMSVRGLEPDWTLVIFTLVSLMLGRWLWLVRKQIFL